MATLARNGTDIAIPMAIQRDPATCAMIKINDQLQLGLGEWFIDTSQGFPWLQKVFGIKNPPIASISAMIRKVILGTPGIIIVNELNVSYDPSGRVLYYPFKATLNTGAVIKGGDTPFAVQ